MGVVLSPHWLVVWFDMDVLLLAIEKGSVPFSTEEPKMRVGLHFLLFISLKL